MKWDKSPVDSAAVRELARRFGLELHVAVILTRRKITEPQDLRFFLTDDPRLLHNPYLMSGMTDAVERINAAIDSGERILIFGDRDVDGVTSTVLLYEALVELGADVQWMLPEGEEAYGLSPQVIERLVALGATLLVTVDCGVSNAAEIELAASRGIDTVVVDHHNPPATLPQAVAVVNPKLPGYPFRDLSGCGVVSKLDWALRFSRSAFFGVGVCLLNVRPANDALVVEAVRLTNLVESGRISESIIPGLVPFERTRLAGFLAQDELLVLDAPQQARLLSKAFGDGISASLSDLTPLVAQFLPDRAGKSLLRIMQGNGAGRFAANPDSEIDTLRDLFVELVLAREESRLAPVLTRADLVTLGTLADLMPLVDENRVMARRGLAALPSPARTGLRQVMRHRELLGKRIGAAEVTWQIAPLLNSAGRMGDPGTATRLLLAQTDAEAEPLLEQLTLLDNQRRSMGEAAWNLILTQAKESIEKTAGRFILVHEERLQRGITGVMASRLQGYFKAPSIVIAEGPEVAVGSIRCNRAHVIEGFFARHGSLFLSYGGHDFAGGFSLPREKMTEFLVSFYQRVEEMEPPSTEEESISIDAEIPIAMLTPGLQSVVDLFEPFGEGNPPLSFLTRGLRITQCDLIGRKDPVHLKLLLDSGKTKWPAVYWNAASRYPSEFSVGDTVDVVYRLARNTYGGGENLQLTIVDLQKPSSPQK